MISMKIILIAIFNIFSHELIDFFHESEFKNKILRVGKDYSL